MADLYFETLLTDCLGQFWKADVVNFLRAPKSFTYILGRTMMRPRDLIGFLPGAHFSLLRSGLRTTIT